MDGLFCVFTLTSLQWERKRGQWILGTVLRPCVSWPALCRRKSLLLAHSPLHIPHLPLLQWIKEKFSVSEAKASTTPSRLTTVEGGDFSSPLGALRGHYKPLLVTVQTEEHSCLFQIIIKNFIRSYNTVLCLTYRPKVPEKNSSLSIGP